MSGAGRGQRQRGSSAGLGRRQGPRCPPAHSGLPGTGDSLPASPSGVGAGYLQCRRRRAVKTPLQQPGNLAGREKEVQGGHGADRGGAGGRNLPAARTPAQGQPPPPSSSRPLLDCLMTAQKGCRPGLTQPMMGRDDLRARLRPEKPIESDG